MEDYRHCNKCGQDRHISEWAKASSEKSGFYYCCKYCRNQQSRDSYYKNKQAISERRKLDLEQKAKNLVITKKWIKENYPKAKKLWSEWAKNNPDKVRNKNAARRSRLKQAKTFYITNKEINKLINSPCFYCGSKNQPSLDHIVPLARGGDHSIGNLTTACKPCNSSKGDSFITEWKNV